MTHKQIIHYPDKDLRIISKDIPDVEIKTPQFQKLIDDMIETMKLDNGVGLAAPQIDIHKRIIIVLSRGIAKAYLNPVITKTSEKKISSQEGCLSVPNIFGDVERHKHIKILAQNRYGKKIEIKANGLLSIIFQHEIDHLNGILFIDKATNLVDDDGKPVTLKK